MAWTGVGLYRARSAEVSVKASGGMFNPLPSLTCCGLSLHSKANQHDNGYVVPINLPLTCLPVKVCSIFRSAHKGLSDESPSYLKRGQESATFRFRAQQFPSSNQDSVQI
ncbi:hypothetical protein PoB_003973000 [Plakobranchus ocellatus]|uniref:Uncharacterized protein n=1 Tax=Plakobranchus ocellatus TaxID=259542 RepID=A0AAV4AXY4_9GAST|nr:hypothetical protein PoB_003973000 [Plakobranchus ocellatus]